MGRCRRHPSHLVVGVCAHCLNHRLLSLLKDDQLSSSPSARPSIHRIDSDPDLQLPPAVPALPPRLSASRFSSGPVPSSSSAAAAAAAAPLHVATMEIMHPTQDDLVSFNHLSVAPYPPAAAAACSATRPNPVISNVIPAPASPTRYYAAEMHSCCSNYNNSPSDLCISRPIVAASAAGMRFKKPASSSSLWRRFTLHLHRQFHGKDSADDNNNVGSTTMVAGAAEGNHRCAHCCCLHPQAAVAAGACIHHGCRVSKSSSRGGDGADAPPSSYSPLIFHLSSPQHLHGGAAADSVDTHQDRHLHHHHHHHRCHACSSIPMPAAPTTKRSDDYCNNYWANRGAMAHHDDVDVDDDDDDDTSYGHGNCSRCSKHMDRGGICYGPTTWRIRSILSRLLSRRPKGGGPSTSPPHPVLEAAKISFSERMAPPPPPPAGSPFFCSSPLNINVGGRPTDGRRPVDAYAYGPGGAEESMAAYASAAASPFRRSSGDRNGDAAGRMPHLPVFTLKLHRHPHAPQMMYQRSHSTKWHHQPPPPPPHHQQAPPPKQQLQHAHRRSHHEFRNQYL